MKVDGSLRSLIQGVSQQPPRTRLPGQCTLQENMSSNPVDGLTRRPPLEWIADLFEEADDVQFYHLRQGSEDYLVCAINDEVKVFTLDGTEKTVHEIDDGFDYLDGNKLAFTTLDNQTFIANTNTKCIMEADLPTFIDYGPIVYVRGGAYGMTYKITVNWKDAGPSGTARSISAEYTTEDGSTVAEIATLKTTAIATELKTALDAVSTNSFNSLFDVFRQEDTLYIQWKAVTGRTDHFTVVVTDNAGNNNILACNNEVKLVTQLPRFAPHGYFVRVVGDGSQREDDYYLEFSVTPDDQGVTPAIGVGFGKAGIWIETVKNKIPYLLDWTTMPHVLTYNEDDDDFDFGPGEWGDRIVGDEDSNPDPSFIGRTINDLGYFQGRLVMVSGPATIMSQTNKPLEMFIASAVTKADSDPIDIESTAFGVTEMLKIVPHNRDLVIFADNAQFIIFGRNSLTPDNSSLVLTTAFESNLEASPVPAGRNIFFAINYGAFTGIREFYTEGSQDINDSRPITQHVLKYLEGSVRHMASTSNFDTLIVQASDRSKLYVYEYIWIGDRKAQSSWSRWSLPNQVMYYFFVESVIYVVSRLNSNYFIEKFDLNVQNETSMNYQVKLDRKVYVPNVNTTIISPVPHINNITDLVFVQGTGCPYPGMRVLVSDFDSDTNTITLDTDMVGGTVIVGQRYRSAYRPTLPFVKDQDGVKVGTGRLVISKFILNCRETGAFEAKIMSPYRDDKVLRYTGRETGNPSSVVGTPSIVDASYVIPFRDNIENGELEIYTDSHEPLTVMDMEWLGQYTKRGKRIVQGE